MKVLVQGVCMHGLSGSGSPVVLNQSWMPLCVWYQCVVSGVVTLRLLELVAEVGG